ncbi:glycoside hydrolase family 88 protein [Sphingomonas sp. BIUV-7]|uniref:Glycoside hydrolase family 88 protein n=1 Tax=Sphingomonas natans TaxID=3063330 RepID=A0ABT8Y5F2_9SPHN|nr:glycoside hydrolase family 88 protein [Sphingomonas sp. BIUV-7]MDO6413553.1 glycoside hydrolase family 88 protein [Sphingomonas sp. BIUV-7]
MDSSIFQTTPFALALALLAGDAHAQLASAPPMSRAAVNVAKDGPTSLAPEYPMPYLRPSEQAIKAVMDRVLGYIDRETQVGMIDASGRDVGLKSLDTQSKFKPGFILTSYEWGVTYAGAMLAGDVTGDTRYTRYAADRINFVADVAAQYRKAGTDPKATPVRNMLAPDRLDDSGAMSAAFIKAQRAGIGDANVRPQIDTYLDWIANKQFRMADGTLARQRPLPVTLWLDDTYMSVPGLAQMGALTGERRYYDDAVRQVLQFSQRMFVADKGLYMHAWAEGMDPHPAFHWGRANGWALMAMVELLDVLPTDHPGRPAVLAQLRAHVAGLAKVQSGVGLWHQLLDRPDSYLETSASAMYAYAIARAVNRGWIDRRTYAPIAMLAWNGVSTKVSAAGEVEDVCVGTGVAFDAAFYYFRPRHVRASHGYGPVLLAGAEVIAMLRKGAPLDGGPGQGLIFQ